VLILYQFNYDCQVNEMNSVSYLISQVVQFRYKSATLLCCYFTSPWTRGRIQSASFSS